MPGAGRGILPARAEGRSRRSGAALRAWKRLPGPEKIQRSAGVLRTCREGRGGLSGNAAECMEQLGNSFRPGREDGRGHWIFSKGVGDQSGASGGAAEFRECLPAEERLERSPENSGACPGLELGGCGVELRIGDGVRATERNGAGV